MQTFVGIQVDVLMIMHILSHTKFEKREITLPIPIICRGWPGAFAETSPDLITYIASGSSPVYSQTETH